MKLPIDFGEYIGVHAVELPNVTEDAYREITQFFTTLINSPNVKSRDAIANAFIMALRTSPHENPSDLWHHVLYRLYRRERRGTNPEQSWVRTSGEAFETALARIYNPCLEPHGIKLTPLITRALKRDALQRMGIENRIGSSKVDVLIEARDKGKAISLFGYGVVGGLHVKVSLAERVSDDIPASRIMMAEGLLSILSTLDVKSFPPPHGDLINRGELGSPERPSDKRKYIEIHGDFDACFSYNNRTVPSHDATPSGRRIYIGDLRTGADSFVDFLLRTVS